MEEGLAKAVETGDDIECAVLALVKPAAVGGGPQAGSVGAFAEQVVHHGRYVCRFVRADLLHQLTPRLAAYKQFRYSSVPLFVLMFRVGYVILSDMNTPDISEYCTGPTATIREVIQCIDRSARISIALIVDESGRLLYTISDGDVRRGILAGISLDAPVTELLPIKSTTPHPRPVTAPVGSSQEEMLRTMRERSVRQLPVVDEEGRVKEVVSLADVLPNMATTMQAVIMAGGFGKRLAPLTNDLPKPMLMVAGHPVMEHIVVQLQEAGINNISVSTHYKPEKIMEHFGNGAHFGVDISYINEDRPLGTGGALGLMPAPKTTQLVINGDVLTRVDFRTMLVYHREHEALMTVGVTQYGLHVPYGVIECKGPRVTALREKPQVNFLVNAGIYLLEPEVYQYIPKGQHMNMTDLIQALLDAGRRVVSFPIIEQWIDIGQHDDYRKAQLCATLNPSKEQSPCPN